MISVTFSLTEEVTQFSIKFKNILKLSRDSLYFYELKETEANSNPKIGSN